MTIDLPSMLAFERKLETSDALMFSGEWANITSAEKWQDIPITKRQNRLPKVRMAQAMQTKLSLIQLHPTVMMPTCL